MFVGTIRRLQRFLVFDLAVGDVWEDSISSELLH